MRRDERFRRERAPWPAEIARDVDEEIASHLAEREEEYAARGLSPAEAAAAAARRFGDRGAIAGACRFIDRGMHERQRRIVMVTDLRQDLGYGARALRRNPGFAVIAVLTLALGIGATTTIFTLANWALLRPVPGVADPAGVSVFWVARRNDAQSFTPSRLSYPNLADALTRLKTVSLGAYQGGGIVAVAGGGQAARNVSAQYVTGSYFEVLGVRMQAGRAFTAAEDTPPSPLLGAVISDRLWRGMFHRDPDVLAQTIHVAGVPFTVLGVAPPGFHGTERLSTTDLWLPGAATPTVAHMKMRYDARNVGGYYELVARLKPGATWPQAEAELDTLRAWLREQYPTENEKFSRTRFHLMGPIGPPPFGREVVSRLIGFAAWAASALVLLIAGANVAGLLVIRGLSRRGEIGIRKALGAGRWRLVRQHLAEGMLIWLLGGAAAVGLVVLLKQATEAAPLYWMAELDFAPAIDWRVLAFSAGLSLLVGLLFSIGPALSATRAEAIDTLRSLTATATTRTFVGTPLAVIQLGGSLTLLIGAYLLAGTFTHLARVPLGFDPDRLFILLVQPGSVGYSEPAALAYVNDFQQRLSRVHGVSAVAAANGAPFFGANTVFRVRSADAAPGARTVEVGSNALLSSTYFETIGIPLIRGRVFTDQEIADGWRGGSQSVVLSESLARRLFGGADTAVGRAIEVPGSRGNQRYDVIGVVGAARYTDLLTPPDEMMYAPAGPRNLGMISGAVIVVRTSGSVAVAEEASAIANALNPALPVATVLSMRDAVARVRTAWDSLALIVGVLATLGTVLACIGLYGVVAHGVTQRRRELGIRLALGATTARVWRLVLRRTAVITGAGVAVGLAGGYAFSQVLSTRLFGVNALDPVLWTLATLSLVAVAVLASALPARTATRVDVADTLRSL